jgi:hypothetical protein
MHAMWLKNKRFMDNILTPQAIRSLIPEAEKILIQGKHFDLESRKFIECLDSVDVVACPGSGKTTALLAKLFILSKFMPFKDNSGICVLTHTNVATNLIKEKLGNAANILLSYPNFVGTIQSFIDKYLALPLYRNVFGHNVSVIDYDKYITTLTHKSRFFNKTTKYWLNLSVRLNYPGAIRFSLHNMKELVDGIDCKPLEFSFKNVTFSSIDEAVIREDVLKTKNRILKSGILCYDDCYALAYAYLRKYPSAVSAFSDRFRFVFIDEMQDTYCSQLSLISNLFVNSIIQRIGDPNQAIYSNHNASDTLIWDYQDKPQIHIHNSKRLSSEIAFAIKNVCPDPESELTGCGGTGLKPLMLLYHDPKKVLPFYANVIEENRHLFVDLAKPDYHAVGWVGEKKDDIEKYTISSYFESYNKPNRYKPIIFESLVDFLINPDIDNPKKAKVIYDSLVQCLLKTLEIVGVNNPMSNRLFTKKTLITHLNDNNPKALNILNSNLAYWSMTIARHKCVRECEHKDKQYPGCILDEIKEYLVTTWIPLFEKDPSLIKPFLDSESKLITDGVDVSHNNEYLNQSLPEIRISVGTVHSVKGETHTATLFLETFNYAHDSKKILKYFINPNESHSKIKPREIVSLKIAYVAMSRPTHMLCVAFDKKNFDESLSNLYKNKPAKQKRSMTFEQFECECVSQIELNGWKIVQID